MIYLRKITIISSLLLILTFLSATDSAAQQKSESNWQTYSPTGSTFSMEIPSNPLLPQGYIFDPNASDSVYKIIENGFKFKVYNFATEKDGKPFFLASILQIHARKNRSRQFVTESQTETINTIVADGIVSSKIKNSAEQNGIVSQWTYKIKAGLGDDNEDDGIIYVRRFDNQMIIIAVSYKSAKSTDPEIRKMLDSLKIIKN